MYVTFEDDGQLRARVQADESNRDELAQWFALALPQLDKWEMVDDFLYVVEHYGEDANGYAVEQTQCDGRVSLVTLRANR